MQLIEKLQDMHDFEWIGTPNEIWAFPANSCKGMTTLWTDHVFDF